MSQPKPKYGVGFAIANHNDGLENWLLTHEVEHLKRHVQRLNEIITELAAELPKDLVLKYTVQPWEKDKSFTPPKSLNDLVTVLREHVVVANTQSVDFNGSYRVPKQLKGRPERVPLEHFAFFLDQ